MLEARLPNIFLEQELFTMFLQNMMRCPSPIHTPEQGEQAISEQFAPEYDKPNIPKQLPGEYGPNVQ